MDYKKITNVEVDGIDTSDHPKYCDAFISYAEYNGVELTDAQYDELNDNSDFVYEAVQNHLY